MSNDNQLEGWLINQEIPTISPFYLQNTSDDKAILNWFKDTDSVLYDFYHTFFREQRNNLQLFLAAGLNPKYLSAEVADFVNYNSDSDQMPGLYLNELYRYTMDQVSLIVSNEITPHALPNNEEYNDKVAAKVVKEWLLSMMYDMDFDLWRIRWEIQKKVFGEAFAVVEWDEQSGDIHPEALEFFDEDLPYYDDEGNEIEEEGKKLKIKKNLRIGDIKLRNPVPWNVQIDPQQCSQDSQWFWYTDWVDTNYLSKKYKGKRFEPSPINNRLNGYVGSPKESINRTKVYYFWHKSHEFMPMGRKIICTEQVMIKNEPLKSRELINKKALPLVRFTDLDYGYGSRSIPILYRNMRNIADGYNKLSNQIYNNLEIESPKILVHVSAGFDGRRMPTGIVVFEWEGSHPPTIITPSTNTSSIFKFREDLKKNMDEMARQTPMVRGDTPNSQLDSFVALQHFEDLRVQQADPDIKGHLKCLQNLFKLMITIAKDNYDPNDGRLIKILGKHNQFQLKYFDPQNLMKVYDVTISTTGSLANSKAIRTQLMIDIKDKFPHLVQDELFIDTLGLSHSEKFMNAITNAVSTAEAENQDMFNGVPTTPPERYEDLITHWDTHRIPMQTLDFKLAPKEVKDLFEMHMTATEKLMYEVASESQAFAARLSGLKQFPLFYAPAPVNAPKPMLGEGDVQGNQRGFAPVQPETESSPLSINESNAPQALEQLEYNQNQFSPS